MSDILMFEENICVSVVTSPFLRWWEKCSSYRWVITVVCEDEWVHRQTDGQTIVLSVISLACY